MDTEGWLNAMDQIKTITINDNLITKAKKKEFWDFYLFVAVLLAIFLLMFCFFRRTVVVGHSMDSTLFDGQNLIMERTKYNNNVVIDNGDIVVIDNDVFGGFIIKRVIGTPGDTIAIYQNVVYVNGVALEEDYIKEAMETPDIAPFTLPEGRYFVMGDNRNNSTDSRIYGTFPEEEIFGKVVFDIYHFKPIVVPEIFNQFRA